MNVRLLALFAALAALPANGQDIKCEGAFAADSSAARLEQVFGADNVVTGETDGAESSTIIASVVYPDDIEKMMTFVWVDESTYQGLSYVELNPAATVAGLVRGMSVAEVEALNGEPFILSGFWWDYGGYAAFPSGRLAALPGGCSVAVYFEPSLAHEEGVDIEPITGDRDVSSHEPLLQTVGARLSAMTLSYPPATQ